MLELESSGEGDRPGGEGDGEDRQEKEQLHPRATLRLPTQFSLIFPLIVAGIFLAGFLLSLSRTVLQKRPKHRSFVVLSTFKVSS